VGLSTAEVFRETMPPETLLTGDEARRAAEIGDIEELGRRLHNRLQAPAERLLPAVAQVRAKSAATGPAGTSMTGSGSTVFALCRSPLDAQRVARGLESSREGGDEFRVRVVRSCD
jgi:4-diphosphocytidyl-2-C-methyl-D-erythritol kinase